MQLVAAFSRNLHFVVGVLDAWWAPANFQWARSHYRFERRRWPSIRLAMLRRYT